MTLLRQIFSGLATGALLLNSLPAFSDTLLIPRLGYTTASPKRIYLDITTPEERKAEIELQKQQEKAEKEKQQAEERLQKEQRKQGDESGHLNLQSPIRQGEILPLDGLQINRASSGVLVAYHSADSEAVISDVPVNTERIAQLDLAQEEPAPSEEADADQEKQSKKKKSPEELAKEEEKQRKREEKRRAKLEEQEQKRLEKKQKEDLKYAKLEEERLQKEANLSPEERAKRDEKEEARKRASAERVSRQKARMAALMEENKRAPVNGSFFLYDLKQDRLQYQEVSPLQQSEQGDIAPYYVEFKQGFTQGLYDLAVVGSGHRGEQPVRVADTIYWDALRPVLQDISRAHCPQQTGRYRVIQYCFEIHALPHASTSDASSKTAQIVQGGWYVDGILQGGVVKDTIHIADIAQILLHTYEVNPKSYKYLALDGVNFARSRYPDLLDEINWGIQYLLTIQRPDGSFPAGIERTSADGIDRYRLLPETPKATARAVMALATAVTSFRPEDLGLGIKLLRSAERGWQYLKGVRPHADPEDMLLASSALMLVSDNPEYASAFEEMKSEIGKVPLERALLLPASVSSRIAIRESQAVDADPGSRQISSALPLLAELRNGALGTFEKLSHWITNLYGYEEVALVRDNKLELVSAWQDPLQWAATKTGHVATRFGHRISDSGIYRNEEPVTPEKMKEMEEKELAALKMAQKGYNELELTTMDRAYLSYMLALLNQQVVPRDNPGEVESPQPRRYEDPLNNRRGFYPKPL